jgi:hypothetical protein
LAPSDLQSATGQTNMPMDLILERLDLTRGLDRNMTDHIKELRSKAAVLRERAARAVWSKERKILMAAAQDCDHAIARALRLTNRTPKADKVLAR